MAQTMKKKEGSGPGWEAPKWLRTGLLVVLGIGVLAVLVLAIRPAPVPVDLAEIVRGGIEVAVEEDGRTRVRDRYLVTAPIAATLRRITLEAGDLVEAGDALAQLDGPESGIPDSRTRAQLEVRLGAAEAGVERARALVEVAEAGVIEARDAVRRQELLLETSGGSPSAVERARALLRAREAEVRSATFGVRAAEGEVEDIRLALRAGGGGGSAGALTLRAPVSGTVLRVHRESGGAVGPGEPLVEVGDPAALEVVVDLLSADAVRVGAGAAATLRGWGGEGELDARVRRVEPAGFTRVSALGIEEQRVAVILEPPSPDGWPGLGDGFRVEARILIDRVDDVPRAPMGALFRRGEAWAAFVAVGGRVEEREVRIGRRSQAEAEILSGIEIGERVIVYPSDRVEDGVRYRER